MAGRITALKIQKRNKERVNVYLDDQYALAVTLGVAAGLKKGQQLSDSEIEALKREDKKNKAYHQALRFLGFRARSQQEMVRYLEKKGYAPEVVEETINRLLQEQYLDDEAFARAWLNERERLRPRGTRALRYELKQKGIEDRVIDTVLNEVDDAELAWMAVERKLHQWRNLNKENFDKKLLGFLGRRGFDYELSRTILNRARTFVNLPE
jgi:regulatory protein